jgi:uncharacterized protein YbjT (DUF2867 family)
MTTPHTFTPQSKKRILLVGGSGAQGQVIARAIAPRGKDSPYVLRILTRDPTHKRVQELYGDDENVELVKGELSRLSAERASRRLTFCALTRSFMDFELIEEQMKDCYGVFVNTDGALGVL